MIIDANVILRAFFPDEVQAHAQAVIRDHVTGQITLKAPSLLLYEVCNAVWQAERRGRIPPAQADLIIQSVQGLKIPLITLEWGEMMPWARQFGCSAYDAAYLALAQAGVEPFITGDERLYNAVHAHLSQVIWLEDYNR